MSDRKNLTAGDLIAELQKLEPSTPVFVRGYEGGVDYVVSVAPVKVKLFANTEWYYGEHEEPYSYEDIDESGLTRGVQIHGEHVRESDER